MRLLLHVVGLPHTSLEDEFSWCAYTGKVRRFATMMKGESVDVLVYHSGSHDPSGTGDITDYVQIFSEEERIARFNKYQKSAPPFNSEIFSEFNFRCISAINQKISKEHHNIICLIGGTAQSDVAKAFQNLPVVEFGVGYAGVLPNTFRCFESYSWMHVVYGATMGAYEADGRNYDTVIPNYYNPEDFSLQLNTAPRDGYLLYLARTDPRKGVNTAIEVAKATGAKLVIAGNGPRDFDTSGVNVKDIGFVKPEQRRTLLQGARALIQPTNFLEPFGGCVAEALLSGVPVLTSDWGAFAETVVPGRDGFRCRTLSEYIKAWNWTGNEADLYRDERFRQAVLRFSVDNVKFKYLIWLKRIAELYTPGSAGWYSKDI